MPQHVPQRLQIPLECVHTFKAYSIQSPFNLKGPNKRKNNKNILTLQEMLHQQYESTVEYLSTNVKNLVHQSLSFFAMFCKNLVHL